MKSKTSLLKILWMLVLLTLIFMLSSCSKEPIKIGMIGSLSSKQSQLSIDARNAVEIGISEINAEGGINGALLKLVVKDDGASQEVALRRHQEFLDEDVHLVIGHTTSNMASAVLESEGRSLLFMSPSMSIETLSNRDDYFLRTSPLSNDQGYEFMAFIEPLQLNHITVIYDLMNKDYTESVAETVEVLALSDENLALQLLPFDSRENQLSSVIEQIDFEKTECILMLSQATDTAFLSQKIKLINENIMLTSVSWSMTQDLIHNGGAAVEDMYFIGVYHAQEASERLVSFESRFNETYGYQPSFISVMAYDATIALSEGLKLADSPSPMDVKKGLLSIEEFEGLEETYKMNAYGDCKRRYLIYQLQGGAFKPLYD